ncbi:MAG: TonB family protein [Bryobacteraceae bacterium]|jgi:TonB family protein
MTAMTQAISTALLDFVWQGLLAAFLLWAALFALKSRSARARYLASCVALAVMAVLPVVTACLVYTAPAATQASAGLTGAVPETMRAAMPGPAGSGYDWVATRVNRLAPWALPLWSLGVLLFSLRLVWAGRQISALRRQAKPAEAAVLAIVGDLQERMKLARSVRVLVSAVADCPSVVGWIKPVVLVPAATVLGLTPQQLEAVLSHELAHILRHDYLVNMLQTVVETLLFYHPAVWWASARIRQERELCCDDMAVDASGDAICYARALTRLERLRAATPRLALSSAGGPLSYRIRRLVGDAGWQRGPSKLPGILALSLGLICFALNMQWARGQQPDTPAPALEPTTAAENGIPDEPGVRIDLGGASLIHRDEVEYPEGAIQKGVQGTVVVEATLDAAGQVSDARVLSGPPELRKAALQSVLQWHFTQDAAGGTRQIGIAFQLPADGDGLPRSADQRSRRAEARELAEVQREQADVQANAQANVQALRKQLAESMAQQARNLEGMPADAMELEDQARRLAGQMAKMQAERNLASDKLAQKYADQARELEDQLRGAQQVLQDHERALAEYKANPVEFGPNGFYFPEPVVAGRKLKTIDIRGLPAASRDELLAKLPVHVGDTLAADSLERIKAAVKQFDEHLGFSMSTTRDGQVAIRIAPRGSSDRLEPR